MVFFGYLSHLIRVLRAGFIYDFGVLATFDVSGNKITTLHQALGKLVSLTSLLFADNLLDELPLELGLLTKLEHLSWRGNRLRVPPEICDGLFSVRTPTENPRGADRTIKYFERSVNPEPRTLNLRSCVSLPHPPAAVVRCPLRE